MSDCCTVRAEKYWLKRINSNFFSAQLNAEVSEETKTSNAKDSILLGKFRQRGETVSPYNKELHYVSTLFISDPEL